MTIFAAGFTSAAATYLRATVSAGSSDDISECDNLFVNICAMRGKHFMQVQLWGGYGLGGDEPSGDGRLEAYLSLFIPGAESPS